MPIYTSAEDVRAFIINLKPNNSVDNTDIAINGVIEQQGALIANIAANLGYTLPASTIVPTTALEYLLWLLNIEHPVYVLYLSRASNPDTVLNEVARAVLLEAQSTFLDYTNGELSSAFDSLLPTTALAQASDVVAYLSGFNISPITRIPETLVARWIIAESVWVYAISAKLGYVIEPYSSFSDEKKRLYRNLIVERIAAHVLRMRAPQAPQSALIEQSNILYLNSAKERIKLKNRLFDYVLAV
jgi:hypothetical protein